MSRLLLLRLASSTLMLLFLFGGSALAQDQLVMGIHPYKSPDTLLKSYMPLAAYLARRTGLPVTIVISKDYKDHIQAIGSDKLDIAYMGPASYVKLVDQYGKKPLLACQVVRGKPTFQGKIIVRKESTLRSLGQLTGKSFAFGDPESTMSHLVPRYMLWKAGVGVSQLKHYKFLGSHDNVALSVLAGEHDAGAVKETVYYKYKERGLRALTSTPKLAEHVFVASNKLDPAIVLKLREAFLSLDQDAMGVKIMSSMKPGITAMRSIEDKNYDNLRKILRTLKRIGAIK